MRKLSQYLRIDQYHTSTFVLIEGIDVGNSALSGGGRGEGGGYDTSLVDEMFKMRINKDKVLGGR